MDEIQEVGNYIPRAVDRTYIDSRTFINHPLQRRDMSISPHLDNITSRDEESSRAQEFATELRNNPFNDYQVRGYQHGTNPNPSYNRCYGPATGNKKTKPIASGNGKIINTGKVFNF